MFDFDESGDDKLRSDEDADTLVQKAHFWGDVLRHVPYVKGTGWPIRIQTIRVDLTVKRPCTHSDHERLETALSKTINHT